MKRHLTRSILALLLIPTLALAGCDSGAQPAAPTATTGLISTPTTTLITEGALPIPTSDGTLGPITGPTIGSADPLSSPVTLPTPGENAPTPTNVIATGTGDAITALQTLEQLKPKAIAWQKDARIGLLSNIRPGQQKNLLGTTLGDPNVNESTPGGKGRNWTLVAFSPSTNGAVAISADGTQVDLVKEGVVTEEALARFNAPHLSSLNLDTLTSSQLVDSDALFANAKMGEQAKSQTTSIALLAPDGLGLGPLPTPSPQGDSPQLAYEAFSTNPRVQTFIFFDAHTGSIILDSSAP